MAMAMRWAARRAIQEHFLDVVSWTEGLSGGNLLPLLGDRLVVKPSRQGLWHKARLRWDW